ncbi:MAG: YqgE/AlgH family protein [Saprospiraceae bacterium]|nr:YqgE/AlgH family protein [Saprospiraceae bacterium]MBK7812556.1 YqgE/AlgH family protein [Saprospiraceae bacterium]MBK9630747.1 YqgE/AlgH family protein [Saprospiraceae bacterium]
MSSSSQITAGSVLLSEPFMLDPNFKRTAVLIVDHTIDEGTVGFVLNRNTGLKFSDFIEEIGDFDAPVYEGGPVSTNTLHYLHNVGELLEESILVCPGIYWGGDFESLKFLIEQKLVLPENIRFFMGYSGWSSHQLEEEIAEKSWVLAKMDTNYLFRKYKHDLWKLMMNDKGEHWTAISQMDGDHIFN